ncbi:MAG TPA: hypothetical protein VLJ57_10570 [Burkholderiaceae bacterium]|nr:hypothetical protein [Burkholderiaceae bacterium]
MESMPAQFEGLAESDREELRLLYQVCVTDIGLFTRQQWSVTNYAMAFFAALLFIAYQPPTELTHSGWQNWLLVVLAWAVTVSGLAAVKRLQISIVGGRRRLERARSSFGRPFQEVWAIPKPPDDVHRLLYLVMLLGAAIVTLLVVAKP